MANLTSFVTVVSCYLNPMQLAMFNARCTANGVTFINHNIREQLPVGQHRFYLQPFDGAGRDLVVDTLNEVGSSSTVINGVLNS